LAKRLKNGREKELRLKGCVTGAHRDDLAIDRREPYAKIRFLQLAKERFFCATHWRRWKPVNSQS
jgi:hypothetical protein